MELMVKFAFSLSSQNYLSNGVSFAWSCGGLRFSPLFSVVALL